MEGKVLPGIAAIRLINNKGIIKMRKPIIVGNWKMNKTPSDAVALVEQLKGQD